MAIFSHSSSQKSRGMIALCWLGVPSRWLQRLNLLNAILNHPTKRTTERPARLAQCLMNSTIESRVFWETQAPFRVPQALFLA